MRPALQQHAVLLSNTVQPGGLLPRPVVRQREVGITRDRLQAAYPRVDPLVGGEGTG